MKLTVPTYHKAKILVVGDIMLDRYWHGGTSRISPEAPVPVVRIDRDEDRPGGAANVALNIAALGCDIQLMGVTGDDPSASVLTQILEAASVECDFLQLNEKPTITKLRVISRHQQLIRLDFEEKYTSQETKGLLEKFANGAQHAQCIVLSDYDKGALYDPKPFIASANKLGIPVLVDPKGADFKKYAGATLLTPNLSEFEAVVGACEDESMLIEKGLALMKELEIKGLLITRGERGMTLLQPGKPEFHLPARAREVFDVTGAGDTVISVIASSLAAGSDIREAIALSNLAASIVVGKLGTAAISAPELRRAVQQEQGSGKGMLTEEQLLIVIDDAREHKERIVFTNGCFDILHAGHVTYLDQARQKGDRLIVAVNSDASVNNLKGDGRPINIAERRMAVLAGLEAVDWVVQFDSDTPISLLEAIKPDVLVKGGDYGIDEVVGADIVNAYGGEVFVLDMVEECSTTRIVDQIRKTD